MSDFLIYLLKSAGLLSIFYVTYQLLLKRDTSFFQNRKFLLGGLFSAAVFPGVYFTNYVVEKIPFSLAQLQTLVVENPEKILPETNMDWWLFTGVVYFGIFGFCFCDLFFKFFLL